MTIPSSVLLAALLPIAQDASATAAPPPPPALVTKPTTRPATTQALSLEELRRQNEQQMRLSVADTPLMPPPRPIDRVVRLSLVNGLIDVVPAAGETDGLKRVELSDVDGMATVNASDGAGPDANRPAFLEFQHVEFAPPNAIMHALIIFARGDYVQIAWDETGVLHSSRMQLIQAPQLSERPDQNVRFYYDVFENVTDEQLVHKQFGAESFAEMLRQYPDDTVRHVIEPLRRRHLHASVLATPPELAWQVLGAAVDPPAAVKAKVDALVQQLNSEQFAQRESAGEELKNLGAAGAIVLQRIDRSKLSEEQLQAIESVLARYTALPEERVAELSSSPAFLIGCLYADDAALWPVAAEAIKKRFGQNLKVGDSREAMRREADRLLTVLLLSQASRATTRPTTKP